MSDEVYYAARVPLAGEWEATCQLRWLDYPGSSARAVLQQLWVQIPDTARRPLQEWRDVPVVVDRQP